MEEQATYTSSATHEKPVIADVGAAFPCEHSSFADFNEGMTLRDYVAAKVFAAIIGSFPNLPKGVSTQDFSCKAAKSSFNYADEFLAARGNA